MNLQSTAALVPVLGIRCLLRYAIDGVPGAMAHAYLAESALERLLAAKALLRELAPKVELLVWDAYRKRETQLAIFETYRNDLARQHPGASADELSEWARSFVSDPDGVFPHGTGGAVDLTLMSGGTELWMGTDFDEFVPEASPDWFREHPPTTTRERLAHRNRELLRTVMEKSGFVGIPTEWWHWEFGTRTWREHASQRNRRLVVGIKQPGTRLLDKVLDPPACASPAQFQGGVVRHLPAFQAGVAQIFTTAVSRRDALAHVTPGHYYHRESQPTTTHLAQRVATMLGADPTVALFESGKAACVATLKALMPDRGRLLCDWKIYYEIQSELLELARRNGWDLVSCDFTDLDHLKETALGGLPFDVVYADNPRNWYLDTLDLQAIGQIAKLAGAICVVDVSVHPLQKALDRGADVVVCSLSKYPSAGLDMGGAVASCEANLLGKIRSLASAEGHVLGASTASVIWQQIESLNDRFSMVSEKATKIAAVIKRHEAVANVRIPNPSLLGGLPGGQLSFNLKDPAFGPLLEQIVQFNANSDNAALHLMCTFGATKTAIEHFRSNPRCRPNVGSEATNEGLIPWDMVRLGIGLEPVDEILDQLTFALDSVCHYNAKRTSNLLHSEEGSASPTGRRAGVPE